MIVLIVLAAFAVMAAAAIAGTGRLGEWREPVNDSPKGHLPGGDVDADFIDELVTPRAPFGYDRDEVDAVYDAFARGEASLAPEGFTVARGGYDMEFVDEVLRRAAASTGNEPARPSTLAPTDRMDDSTTKE
ncbi:MAG: hypothetical protein GX596_13040 [Propionibacterium sp.]|nr:hypothetical protein [Propionibacterium sp.]